MARRILAPDLFSLTATPVPTQVPPPVTPEAAPETPPIAAPAEPPADPHAATYAELGDAAFMAVAGAMRGWTIGLPGQQAGAGYANARHVRQVLRALRGDGLLPGAPTRPDARPLLRQVVHGVQLGHVQLRPDMGEMGRREFERWLADAVAATEARHG